MSSNTARRIDDIETKRRELEAFEQLSVERLGPLPETLEELWTTIELPDGWQARTKVIRPSKANLTDTSPSSPLIVLFHGGAFNRGTPIQITHAAREFAVNFGAIVVCPTYKLLPEYPWPAPMRSGWEILVYLSKHAERDFSANLSSAGGGFIVGGVSSGGTIAAVAAGIFALGLKSAESLEQLAHPLTGVMLNSAILATEDIVPEAYQHLWTSREDNKNNPWFNTAQLDAVVDTLAADARSPWFSPLYPMQLRKPVDGPRGLRFYLQACNYDPLRDDHVVFHKVLTDLDFPSKLDVFPDDLHAAWMAIPFESKSQSPSIGEASMIGMKWLLGVL